MRQRIGNGGDAVAHRCVDDEHLGLGELQQVSERGPRNAVLTGASIAPSRATANQTSDELGTVRQDHGDERPRPHAESGQTERKPIHVGVDGGEAQLGAGEPEERDVGMCPRPLRQQRVDRSGHVARCRFRSAKARSRACADSS